tara:strand:- start:172 stop:747 length:576 start_codon:yes stop_codon:yes gene_type:complete
MSILLLENYIKNILKENKEFIKTINVFDFDMTLFRSLSAPKRWNTKRSGFWWNAEESLNQAYYKDDLNSLWIESTIKAVKSSMHNPEALTVLCTARNKTPETMYVTNELLRLKGLLFDDSCLYYKPLGVKKSTAQYKTDVIINLLNAYSYTNTVNFWEDNIKNLQYAKKFIDQNNMHNNRKIQFNSHIVSV